MCNNGQTLDANNSQTVRTSGIVSQFNQIPTQPDATYAITAYPTTNAVGQALFGFFRDGLPDTTSGNFTNCIALPSNTVVFVRASSTKAIFLHSGGAYLVTISKVL